jgi:hypothetical protein
VHVARHAIAIGIARHAGQQVERACQVPLDGVARRREIQALDLVEGIEHRQQCAHRARFLGWRG